MSVREYYNEYWTESGFCPSGSDDSTLRDLLTSHLPEGKRILDLGCGDGLNAGKILTDLGDYVGVDVSETAVKSARQNGYDASLIEDAVDLPFDDETVDAVVSMEVIEHLMFPLRAVEEVSRILKPGGIVLLTTPNIAYWRLRLDMLFRGRWNPLGDTLAVQEPWRDPHIRFFTTASMRGMLNSAGLEVLDVGGIKGRFLMSLPGAQSVFGRRFSGDSSWVYRKLEKKFPSLLSNRLFGVARKPLVASVENTIENRVREAA
ncbi:MAG: class I SAM-dependent methyltransferase [Fuerstiella sp.]